MKRESESPAPDPAKPSEPVDRAIAAEADRDAKPPDPVEEASEESFPASDPPAWEPLHSGPPTTDESSSSG